MFLYKYTLYMALGKQNYFFVSIYFRFRNNENVNCRKTQQEIVIGEYKEHNYVLGRQA